MKQFFAKIKRHLPNKLKRPLVKRLERTVKSLGRHLLLPCAVAIGLIPPLIFLLLLTLWQLKGCVLFGESSELDVRHLAAALLLLSPFLGGFARVAFCPKSRYTSGAAPAFVLWLGGLTLYHSLFGMPNIKTILLSLAVAVMLGMAGGLSAQRIDERRHKKSTKKSGA